MDVPCCLPFHASRFVGRKSELKQVYDAFAQTNHRAVTLAGTGGAGKTRLATQFAQEQQRTFPGGVWFCDLSEAHSIGGMTRSVARSLSFGLSQSHHLSFVRD